MHLSSGIISANSESPAVQPKTFALLLASSSLPPFLTLSSVSLMRLLNSYQQGSYGDENLSFVIPRTIELIYMIVEHLFRLWLICHTADLIRSKALSLVPVLQSIRNDLYSRQDCGDESQEVKLNCIITDKQ